MKMRSAVLFLVLPALAAVQAAQAADKLPETTPEGLVLQKKTKLEVVYLRPGVNFSVYDKVALLDCAVAFRKDWQRDQSPAPSASARKTWTGSARCSPRNSRRSSWTS